MFFQTILKQGISDLQLKINESIEVWWDLIASGTSDSRFDLAYE